MLIDSHCHLNYAGLVDDQQGALARARAAGVGGFLNISTRQREWAAIVALAEQEADVWASVGIHPHEADAHADLGATLHRISNIEIRSVDGGVQSRCYVDALLCPIHEGGPLHRGIGYYDDHLTRTANGWQIARRQFHAVLLE